MRHFFAKKIIFIPILAFAFGLTQAESNDFSTPSSLIITNTQKSAFQLGSNLLKKHHYRELALRDISSDVFDKYLQSLDYGKIYFLKSDIDEFSIERKTLPLAVKKRDLSFAVDVFNRYRKRATALNEWTLQRLKEPFDLDTDKEIFIPSSLQKNSEEIDWRNSLEEVHEYQEKSLIDALIRLRMGERSQEEALQKLVSRYESQQKRLNQMTVEDVFDLYMNTIALRFDPHSNYLSPRSTEDFDINMSLSLEGIGATLSYEDGKISIDSLVPGGPAYKSNKLHINDRIIGVGQGKEGEIQDIVGLRLDKAVRLIRGKKGSYVRLLIEPANTNAGEKEILIQRDTINLEEQAAQGYIEEVTQGGVTKKIGVIRLPSFYLDFNGASTGKSDYRSTSRDMANILKNMKEKQIEGLIIDLRGDGGGSLYEAVKTVGLFIDEGPVVMISDANNGVETQRDNDRGALYEGPLVVMIDHNSASASEIFAAAIQDYQRGVIVGSNSFGKGTVQTVIELNRFVPRTATKLGEMKMTIAMFYRITGGSTQDKGVTPDITLPSSVDIKDIGERSKPYALPWKAINAEEFKPHNDIDDKTLAILQANHVQRMAETPALVRYQQYVEKSRYEQEKTQWSLNLAQRKQEYEQWKIYIETYERKQAQDIMPLNADAKRKADVEKRNAVTENKADREHFVPDVGLYEALYILFDYIDVIHRELPLNKAA